MNVVKGQLFVTRTALTTMDHIRVAVRKVSSSTVMVTLVLVC